MNDVAERAGLKALLRESMAVRAAMLVVWVVLGALGIVEARLSALQHRIVTRRIDDAATLPSSRTVALLSLGHREWAADVLWSAALVYFGDSIATHSQQRFLQRYADTIEDVDPRFRPAYLWGATVSVYNARVIRRESVENAIHHLERGLRVFPADGEMTFQLGFNYYIELPRFIENPEERLEAQRRGAEYMRRAAALGHGPQWMALVAANALEQSGLRDQAIRELQDALLRTEDPAIRERIERQIRDLAGEGADADPAVAEMRRLTFERQSSLPYVPAVLYLFVGPPVPGIIDVREPIVPGPPTERPLPP